MLLEVEWWRRACEENPHAIAFVGTDDKFLYVNNAWCKLCGWSAAQLIQQKKWQDITLQEDVGSDQASAEEVKAGSEEEYYLEKEYVSPTGQRRGVGLYVRRHPPFGPQKGYIVFGTPLNSREQEALKQAYIELKNNVTFVEEQQHLLIEQQKGFRACKEEIKYVKEDVRELKDSQTRLTSRIDNLLATTMKEGDHITMTTGNEHVGGNKMVNSTTVMIVLGCCLIGMTALLVGGRFMFDHMKQQLLIESQRNQPPVQVEINE